METRERPIVFVLQRDLVQLFSQKDRVQSTHRKPDPRTNWYVCGHFRKSGTLRATNSKRSATHLVRHGSKELRGSSIPFTTRLYSRRYERYRICGDTKVARGAPPTIRKCGTVKSKAGTTPICHHRSSMAGGELLGENTGQDNGGGMVASSAGRASSETT